ncbi:MAG: GNAT family N-acetyltransferase [Flammeovirgaceae bacterium]|jgi:ribosomal protein S18 acetylase RimI-like enzyme|nr:GNAT family N-acetyltransferase [Flammeovirgaceae bacterium]
MEKITIRLSTLEDTAAMREVAISSYDDTFADSNTPENMESFFTESYSLSKLQDEYYEPLSVLYLACDGEKVVGFLRLRVNDEVKNEIGENTIELQRLYIDTAYHGKQIGKHLMEKALIYARENHYDWIWLGVWERNFNAQHFYDKWGFEKFGEHIFQMGDDPQIDWLLKKKL